MGSVVFAAVLVAVLGLAVTSPRLFCLAVLVLSGLPMPILTGGQRFLSGSLEVDAQALYMFAVLVGSALILGARAGRLQRELGRLPLVWTFLAFAAVSLVWCDSLVYGLRMLVKLATPILFMWALATACAEGLRARDVVVALLYAATLSIALAIVNAATGGAIEPLIPVEGLFGLRQLAAPYTSPSNFSFTLSIVIIVSFGAWSVTRRLGWLGFAAVLLIAVAFALCRAAIAGLLLSIVAFHLARQRLRTSQALVVLGVVLVAGALLASSPAFKHRMFFDADDIPWSTLLTNREVFLDHLDTSGRNDLWQAAGAAFRDTSTVVGGGVGSVDRWIRERDVRASELHSDVFRVYLDLGITGLALYLAAIASIGIAVVRQTVGEQKSGALPIGRVSAAALACYVATLPTDNSINYATQFGVVVFGIAGLALAHLHTVKAAASPAGSVGGQRVSRRFANVID